MWFRLLAAFVASHVMGKVSTALAATGMPLVMRLALYASFMFAVLLASMWYWQESILYLPSVPNPQNPMSSLRRPEEGPPGLRSPSEKGIDYQDIELIGSDGVRAHAWFIPAPGGERATAPTLLFSHENAGSMALRMPHLEHGVCSVR